MNGELITKELKEIFKVSKSEHIDIYDNGDTWISSINTRTEGVLFVRKKAPDNFINNGNNLRISKKAFNLVNGPSAYIEGNKIISNGREIIVDELEEVNNDNIIKSKPKGSIKVNFNEFIMKLGIVYATANETTRPVLNGVCLSGRDMVACDGYRMATRPLDTTINEEVIIPRYAVEALRKCNKQDGDIKIQYYKEYLDFILPNGMIITSARVCGNYIDCKSLMNISRTSVLKINAKDLFKIVNEYRKANFKYIKLTVGDFKVLTEAEMFGFSVKDMIIGETEGEEIRIQFSTRYLGDSLKKYDGDISIYLNTPVSAILIEQGENKELVLPVRMVR